MIFSRPLVIESSLPPRDTRERVRTFATSRDLPNLEAFRRQQVVSWRLSESNEDFLFQPEYGDALDIEGARFVALVETASSGSRIRGRVVASPLTRVVMSMVMLFVVVAAIAALAQGRESPAKVLAIVSAMLATALLMIRYSLWSTSRLVTARLGQCLEAAGPRAVA